MCTTQHRAYNTDRFEIQKRDSEEGLLTFVNLFSRYSILEMQYTYDLN